LTTTIEKRGAAQQMLSTRDQLKRLLVETKSYVFSPEPFTLASGAPSHHYVDCKVGLSYAETRRVVGELILSRIDLKSIDAVGGLIIGAYPIAIAVSDAAFRTAQTELRAFVVRKVAKPHGRKKLIEGAVKDGDRVLVVDDVITSGQSTVEAIHKCREEGLNVVKAIAIVDRQEQDGRAQIEAEGVPFESLCTLQELQALSEVASLKSK
jgi:orotate phosphoribosyltransferase